MFILLFLISWLTFSTLMSLWIGEYFIILWVILGFFVGWIMILLGLVFHTYVFGKLPLNSKYKYFGWQSAARAIGLLVFNLRIEVVGKENVPMDGKLVAYSNHKSYLDPLIAIQAIDRPMGFTPKSTLLKIPFFKDVILRMSCMPIYREDNRKTAKALVQTIKNIEDGFAMIVFPEGGRKNRDTDSVLATKAGSFQLAVKPKATILPMTIIGNSQIQHRAPFRVTKIKVVIHQPIPYEDYKDLTTQQIGDLVSEKINEGLIE